MKITITRALANLKLLDKRIQKTINNSIYSTISINGKNQHLEFNPKADLQSANDLITQRAKIKSAIMVSNSKTKIKIGKEKMTVIEAIEMKSSIMYKKMLLNKLVHSFNHNTKVVEQANITVEAQLDTHLAQMFGKDTKVNATDFEAISKPFLKARKASLVDPLGLEIFITKLDKEIETFESEVDLTLSESNAKTEIEI